MSAFCRTAIPVRITRTSESVRRSVTINSFVLSPEVCGEGEFPLCVYECQ